METIHIGIRDQVTEVGPTLSAPARKRSDAGKNCILRAGGMVGTALQLVLDRLSADGAITDPEELAIRALQVRADEISEVIARASQEAEDRRRELDAARRAISQARKERLHLEWIAQHKRDLADIRAADEGEPCSQT